MDLEIKRLLKLSNIPGFKLTKKEQATLEAWKKEQKPVKPKKAKKAPKGYTILEGMGSNGNPTMVKTKDLGEVPEEVETITNDVKTDEKENGDLAKV